MKLGRARGLALALAAFAPAVFATGAAVALELSGQAIQGGLIVGRADASARVALDGRTIRVAPDGRFLIGFGRDHGPRAQLTVTGADGRVVRRPLAVAQRRYDIQRIDGLPPALVTPDPETLRRIEDDRARIRAARAVETPELLFGLRFIKPAEGPVSGVVEQQRLAGQHHVFVDEGDPAGGGGAHHRAFRRGDVEAEMGRARLAIEHALAAEHARDRAFRRPYET